MKRAYELAKAGYEAGGCPIGAVITDEKGEILGEGHNMLVQEGNPIIHGEMSAMRDAGRMPSRSHTTMYTTLSPCMMCAGTIVQFKIRAWLLVIRSIRRETLIFCVIAALK